MMKKGNDSRSPLLQNRANPRKLGYSTFDPDASQDSGLFFSTETGDSETPRTGVTAVEDVREGVSVSWENIDVFVEIPGSSFLKRLCCRTKENETPTKKQVLSNGK